jgi:hypothetical protein
MLKPRSQYFEPRNSSQKLPSVSTIFAVRKNAPVALGLKLLYKCALFFNNCLARAFYALLPEMSFTRFLLISLSNVADSECFTTSQIQRTSEVVKLIMNIYRHLLITCCFAFHISNGANCDIFLHKFRMNIGASCVYCNVAIICNQLKKLQKHQLAIPLDLIEVKTC